MQAKNDISYVCVLCGALESTHQRAQRTPVTLECLNTQTLRADVLEGSRLPKVTWPRVESSDSCPGPARLPCTALVRKSKPRPFRSVPLCFTF